MKYTIVPQMLQSGQWVVFNSHLYLRKDPIWDLPGQAAGAVLGAFILR